MATPILGSIFKPTDFDNFLEEIGLGDMSPEARLQLVDNMTQSVQYRIITEIFSSLSGEQKLELVRLMQEAKKTGDDNPVNDWLLQQLPDIEGMVDDIVEQEKQRLRPGAATMQKVLDEFLTLIEQRRAVEAEELKEGPLPPDRPHKDGSMPATVADKATPASSFVPSPPPLQLETPAPAPPAILPPLPPLASTSSVDEPKEVDDSPDSKQAVSDELNALP